MEARRTFDWAQNRVSEVTGVSKEQRESAACVRRLEQMAKKRAKQEARKAKEK